MKKVTYTCDLCKREQPVENLNGVHFTGGYLSGRFDLRSARECETHICSDCVLQIEKAIQPKEADI